MLDASISGVEWSVCLRSLNIVVVVCLSSGALPPGPRPTLIVLNQAPFVSFRKGS